MHITLNTVILPLYLKRFASILSVFLLTSGSSGQQACRHFGASAKLDLAFKFFLALTSIDLLKLFDYFNFVFYTDFV